MKLLLGFLLILSYLFILVLYLNNELNRNVYGIILDSFWLTGLSVLFINLVTRLMNIRLVKYLDILPVEYTSKFYKSIGVIRFKKILQKYPIPCSTRKIILKGRSLSSIEDLNKQMIDSEQGHTLGFGLNIVLAILFGTLRDIRFVFWLTVFNVIMNLYPVFVQRFNRNRIRLIIEKHYSK